MMRFEAGHESVLWLNKILAPGGKRDARAVLLDVYEVL